MNILKLIQQSDAAFADVTRDELIAHYKQLRQTGRELNDKLVTKLSEDAMKQAGRKLGFLRGDALYFDNEDQAAVLMDCIYNVQKNGRNAVEQFLIDSPPEPTSDKMACLTAMRQAFYSIFNVESVEAGLGLIARDLFSGQLMPVVDIGLSSTATVGLVIASRLLQFDGFYITGGALLPVGQVPAANIEAWARQLKAAIKPDENGQFDPADFIKSCLSRESARLVNYVSP